MKIIILTLTFLILTNIVNIPKIKQLEFLEYSKVFEVSKKFCLYTKIFIICSVSAFLGAKNLGTKYSLRQTYLRTEQVKLERYNTERMEEFNKFKEDPLSYLDTTNEDSLDYYFNIESDFLTTLKTKINTYWKYAYFYMLTSIITPIGVIIYFKLK